VSGFDVRHGDERMGHGGMTVDTFPTFEEAKDFADWLRDDMAMCGDYVVEFDEIAAFAQAMEEAALASNTWEPKIWKATEERLARG
jgi:hypothetical protein